MAVVRMSLDDSHFKSGASSVRTARSEQKVQPIQKASITHIDFPIKKEKKNKSKKYLVLIAVILASIGMLFVAKNLLAKTGFTPQGIGSIIPALKPELLKDSEGKTNVMLVGIDTRESGTVEMNTDTIILASYDEHTNRLAMLSYPRDLAVSYPGRSELTKINSIYAIGELQKKGTGLEKLKEVVETISGKSIQYYAMVDLKGFMDAIDVVGGIEIYLENDITGLYPTEKFLYRRVSFARGWNTMNGQQALEYSRVRKDVVPASEGGDFGRAKRQQKVIQAVIDKVSKSETLLDAGKVFELVGVASKNLKVSKVSLEDAQAAVGIIKEKGRPSSFTYVLDLYAGGDLNKLIDVINFYPYMLGPVQGANKWTDIQRFTTLYFEEPQLATMTKDVLIYTDGGDSAASSATTFKKQYYYADVKIDSQSVLGINSKGTVYAIGGKQYEPVAKFVAAKLGLTYKAEIPEEAKTLDAKEFSVVAIY